MAKIGYTELRKQDGAEYDGLEADFEGRKFPIRFFAGDKRSPADRLAAIKLCLRGRVAEDAAKRGRTPPEEGER